MDPERLGRFEIEELLGQGGMGSVYAARDVDSGERVAVKVLAGGLAEDEEKLRRFEQEVTALKRVEHPGIVQLSGPIERDGARVFFAMELLEGETLSRRLRREGPMPVPTALRFQRAVLDALAAAHDAGVIHRDIKPGNILITPDERVKVTDFGLARMDDISRLTKTGQLMGTLDYMSPEQCEGAAIDPRSDLYSAGILLFEMLTGEPPFRHQSPGAVLKGHLTESPARVDRIRADLPEGLAEVVRRLLEKSPDDRYGSAAEVLAALDGVRDPSVTVTFHEGSGPTDVKKPIPPRRPGRRRRRLLVAGAVLLMAAAAVAAVLLASSSPYPGRDSVETTVETAHLAIKARDYDGFADCFLPSVIAEYVPDPPRRTFEERADGIVDFAYRLEVPFRGARTGETVRAGVSVALSRALGLPPGQPVQLEFRHDEDGFRVAGVRSDPRAGRRNPNGMGGGPGFERERRVVQAHVKALFENFATYATTFLQRMERDGRLTKTEIEERRRRLQKVSESGPIDYRVVDIEFPEPGRAEVTIRCRPLARAIGLTEDRFVLQYGRTGRDRGWKLRGIRPHGG